jgi:hypothetical protein
MLSQIAQEGQKKTNRYSWITVEIRTLLACIKLDETALMYYEVILTGPILDA